MDLNLFPYLLKVVPGLDNGQTTGLTAPRTPNEKVLLLEWCWLQAAKMEFIVVKKQDNS